MKINIHDGSNYFKGLLLLIRKDKKISQAEADLVKDIGKALGFEKQFCDNAIRDILDNEHIADIPPLFSTKEVAAKFIKDGLSIAHSDNELHPQEEQWLKSTAAKNGLDMQWFAEERKIVAGRKNYENLEVYELTTDY